MIRPVVIPPGRLKPNGRHRELSALVKQFSSRSPQAATRPRGWRPQEMTGGLSNRLTEQLQGQVVTWIAASINHVCQHQIQDHLPVTPASVGNTRKPDREFLDFQRVVLVERLYR